MDVKPSTLIFDWSILPNAIYWGIKLIDIENAFSLPSPIFLSDSPHTCLKGWADLGNQPAVIVQLYEQDVLRGTLPVPLQ